MKAELEFAMSAAKTLPVAELRDFLHSLRDIELEAMTRLCTPTTTATPSPITLSDDDPLDVAEAAAFIGMSKKWIYRNPGAMPTPIRIGNGKRPRIMWRRGTLRIWHEQHKMRQVKR